MGWLFGRKRDSEDTNEMLRRYNEAETARLAAMTSGVAGETATGDSTRVPEARERGDGGGAVWSGAPREDCDRPRRCHPPGPVWVSGTRTDTLGA
jgi:hypothetical protein